MNRKERRAAAKMAATAGAGDSPSPSLAGEIDRLMTLAGTCQARGDLAAAALAYRQAIALAPHIPEACNNLGIVLQGLGRLDEAVAILRRAVALRPDMSAAHNNLGNALKTSGRLSEAVASYRRSLAGQPGNPTVLVNLAIALLAVGQGEEAAECCRRALAVQPNLPEAHFNLGNALKRLGRFDDAVQAFLGAVSLRPNHAEGWLNLGNAFASLDRHDEALGAYGKTLALKPDYAEALSNLGALLQAMGRYDDALDSLRRAVALKPDHAEAHNNMGATLQALGRMDEALQSYRQALALQPASAEAEANLAEAELEGGNPEGAEARCRHAVALAPDNPSVLNNFGNVLARRGRADEALAAFESALARKPDYADVHLNYAMALLRRGRLREGWTEFEWRRETRKYLAATAAFAQPEWTGQALEGKSILLHGEQGLGDVLQFARFATPFAARGARVVLWVQPPLVRLLRTVPGAAEIVGFGQSPPPTDFHLPLMSAPYALGTGLDGIPADIPYLRPDSVEAEAWTRRLADYEGAKVGLVWAGAPRPHDRQAHLTDRRRSLRLDHFAGLAGIPGVTLFSLQKGPPAEQAKTPPPGLALVDFMDGIDDFAGTAALVANLDLVISVDTSTAHLAGALGVPVWILSRFDACWRWLEDREDSPWYPTARLFRQPGPGDWESVLGRIPVELARFAA